MTWRYVQKKWLRELQWLTQAVTCIVGASILVTPENRDSKLSIIEQAMNVDYWAYGLMILSVVALGCEVNMAVREHERWIGVVAWCHTLLCGLVVGYSSAAMAGVLLRVWWNFGSPALGLLLAFLHLMFSKRRSRRVS